ncbi:FliM/FliN family flagellar motor C-terminal domain-containing protein [Yoonia sp. R2331]|uniref:flagellar motor switch protein FliM n=1 Tax=Yoonia sp. R2331 TaxID=3237238 RepID=UPI0034E393B8
MNDNAPQTVLEKMTHRVATAVPDVPLTATRAVTLAVTRAAQNSVALTLNVARVSEDLVELDDLLSELSLDVLIRGLGTGNAVRGVIACDAAMCSAAVEVQTTGRVASRDNEQRPVTRTDAALIEPFLKNLVQELDNTTAQTALDGWVAGAGLMSRLGGPRATGFVLPDQVYRLIRISVEMLDGARKAEVLLALPPQTAIPLPKKTEHRPQNDWATAFPEAVLAAPARLDAVLHQFKVPLLTATQLEVGQLLPLSGCTVDTVRLLAPDGRLVAKARLGQVAGQIAVRVEDGPKLDLRALPPQSAAVPDVAEVAPAMAGNAV